MPPDSDFVQKNLISAGEENKRTSYRNISRQNFIGSKPLVQAYGFFGENVSGPCLWGKDRMVRKKR